MSDLSPITPGQSSEFWGTSPAVGKKDVEAPLAMTPGKGLSKSTLAVDGAQALSASIQIVTQKDGWHQVTFTPEAREKALQRLSQEEFAAKTPESAIEAAAVSIISLL